MVRAKSVHLEELLFQLRQLLRILLYLATVVGLELCLVCTVKRLYLLDDEGLLYVKNAELLSQVADELVQLVIF